MRRGGILILLIGLILIVGAGGLFFFLQTSGGLAPLDATGEGDPLASPAEPTAIPMVEIVVARVPIPASVIITDTVSFLRVEEIEQTRFDRERNVQSVLDVQGKMLLQPAGAGEPILKSNLTEPGLAQRIPPAEGNRPRDKAYPLVVNNLTGVANQVKVNDFVDVIVTFVVPRTLSRVTPLCDPCDPNIPPEMRIAPQPAFDTQLMVSTKTLVQHAQVLQVLRPPVTVEPTPEGQAAAGGGVQVDDSGAVIGPGADLQAAGGTITQGTWTVLLALNAQEAELLEFAQTSDARIVLVLRGAGDSDFEPTIGASMDLLLDEFGLPLPQPPPYYVISPDEQLTAVPTRTPAPTRVP